MWEKQSLKEMFSFLFADFESLILSRRLWLDDEILDWKLDFLPAMHRILCM